MFYRIIYMKGDFVVMKKDILEFKKIFEKVKNIGWIESKRSGPTGIGYTFETLLNKKEDTLEIPDYKSIEIKTQRKRSNSFISLFNATPDGDYLFEIKRLCNTYGYPDKVLKECKVINNEFFASKIKNLGTRYKAKLKVDWENKKLRLIILNICLQMVDNEVSWSFDLLKEKLYRKLKYLAFIEAESKFISDIEYFKYDNLHIYQLRDFNTFLELIEKGIIKVTFKIGVVRNGERKGEINDHGTSFSISKKNLSKLYNVL